MLQIDSISKIKAITSLMLGIIGTLILDSKFLLGLLNILLNIPSKYMSYFIPVFIPAIFLISGLIFGILGLKSSKNIAIIGITICALSLFNIIWNYFWLFIITYFSFKNLPF